MEKDQSSERKKLTSRFKSDEEKAKFYEDLVTKGNKNDKLQKFDEMKTL